MKKIKADLNIQSEIYDRHPESIKQNLSLEIGKGLYKYSILEFEIEERIKSIFGINNMIPDETNIRCDIVIISKDEMEQLRKIIGRMHPSESKVKLAEILFINKIEES